MLLAIALILAVLWLFGFIGHFGGGLIHIVLLIALVMIIYDLFTGRRAVR